MWFTDGDRLCVLRKFPLAHYVQLTLADKEVKKYLLCCHHCLLTSRNCVTGDQCYKSQSVFLLGDPLVSVHWEYRGNFLGVCFKVSTINPFLGSNFSTNEFKWSKYRRQCWYSLSWCDSSFLACSLLHFRSRTMGARLFSQLIAEREALLISYLVWYLTNFWKYLNEDSFVLWCCT